jgi:hypothetical protein
MPVDSPVINRSSRVGVFVWLGRGLGAQHGDEAINSVSCIVQRFLRRAGAVGRKRFVFRAPEADVMFGCGERGLGVMQLA